MSNTSCPGCSGSLTPLTTDPRMGVCDHCGGFVGIETLPYSTACCYVDLRADMVDGEMKNTKYFDFDLKLPNGKEIRVHGWFDPNTKKVLQYG